MNYWSITVVLVLGVCMMASLSRKWCLPAGMSGLIITLATLGAAVFGTMLARWNAPGLVIALGLLAAQATIYTGSILYRFYRDPERTPPGEPAVLVSPADGKVIYVKKLPPGQILESEKKGSRLVLDELSRSELNQQELWQIG